MIVDSAEAILDSVIFTASFEFGNAPTGQYYIVLNHRNSLTTWSKSGGETFTLGDTFNYDFTSAITQAYGNNLISILGKWCIVSGDVNKDGTINASDRGLTWNTRNVTGYNPEDVNGDGIIDSQDRGIIWNSNNRNVKSPF